MNHRDEDDPFEEDIVFDQAGLLSSSRKSGKSAIRRISSGKCATFSKTFALCGAFLGLGLTCAIPGPLSPVPPSELNDDVSLMSPEIMFRCFGFMIGAMFGAKLLDRFNRLFLVFLALLLTAVLVIIIPWCRMAWLLRTDMFLVGATIGFLSTGGNVLCLDLWGRNSGPFMQALQFSFSLGVFLAPLLSQPLMGTSNITPLPTATTPAIALHNRIPRHIASFAPGVEAKNFSIPAFGNTSGKTTLSSRTSMLSISSGSVPLLTSPTPPLASNLSSAASPSSTSSNHVSGSSTSKPPSFPSKMVLPGSLVHAPLTNWSHMESENSSTTHRIPKPKPELTNSDKLQDKNWENNKFRKPPPEDLVPVSSTMKSTTHTSPLLVSSNMSKLINTTSSDTLASSSVTPTSKVLTSLPLNVTSTPVPILQINATTGVNGISAKDTKTTSTPVHAASIALNSTNLPSKILYQTSSPSPTHPALKEHPPVSIALLGSNSTKLTTANVPSHITGDSGLSGLSQQEHSAGSNKLHSTAKNNVTEFMDDVDLQTHVLPVLEKTFVGENSVVNNSTTSQPENLQKKAETLQKLSQTSEKTRSNIMAKEEKATTATLSSYASLKNVSTSTLPSTRRTHHSKPASTVVNDTEITHTVIGAFANRLEKYGLSKMELIYLVVGTVLLAMSLLFLGFLCFNPRDPKSKTDEEEVSGHNCRGRNSSSTISRQTAPPPLPRWLRNTLMVLMLVILMISSGIQAMYGQLLQVFASQSPLQLSESTGTALTATFWGALTSSRFACILLASALSPTAMLVLSVAICSCATWLLSALASSSEVALWIGSVMVGVGTASVFPSGLLWMQRHLVVTHRVASMLVMGPAMGEMLLPMLVYKMMVAVGPGSLVHLPALLSLCVIALWTTAWRLARRPRWQGLMGRDTSGPPGYHLANQNDEDDLLDLTMSPVINGGGLSSRPSGSARSYANGHSSHSFHRLSS